jgi:hypothetical protein
LFEPDFPRHHFRCFLNDGHALSPGAQSLPELTFECEST